MEGGKTWRSGTFWIAHIKYSTIRISFSVFIRTFAQSLMISLVLKCCTKVNDYYIN